MLTRTSDASPSNQPAGDVRAPDGVSGPSIRDYIAILYRQRLIIASFVVAALVIGLLVNAFSVRRYTSTVTLEISRESNRVVNVEGVEREATSADLEFYQTQYGLLKSKALAERVVRQMKLADDPALRARLQLSDNNSRWSLFGGSAPELSPAAARELRVRRAGDELLRNNDVSPVRASRLVNISYTSPDAELSARIANAWAQTFIQSNLQRRFDATSYARNFLEGRLADLRRRLEESEKNLVAYAENQNIVTLSSGAQPDARGNRGEQSIEAVDLAAYNVQLAEATADRVRAEARYRATAGSAPSEAIQNNALGLLRQRRSELAADYAKLLVQFEPGYAGARSLASQIAQLDSSIRTEENRIRGSLRGDYEASVARERAVQDKVQALGTKLIQYKRRSIQYNIYQREVDTNRQLYDGLLQRYKEIGVAGGVGTNNVSIVDDAEVAQKPSQPRTLINLLLSLGLGLVLGVGAAFVRAQLSDVIDDPADVERMLHSALLGVIPVTGAGESLASLDDRKSPIVEAYLSVQTNLEFATAHGAPRSLAVTSTQPAEGKSTTAYALARSLARAGRRVILIDADMRSPSVHGFFGASNSRGLSNYLSGHEVLAELVVDTGVDGLMIMPAGPQPPNAAELLGGARLSLLFADLAQSYDHVVVDAPPVMGLADAPVIGGAVEGMLYVIQSAATSVAAAKVGMSRLATANVTLFGVVLTKFDGAKSGLGYDNGFNYAYGYGYGQTSPRT